MTGMQRQARRAIRRALSLSAACLAGMTLVIAPASVRADETDRIAQIAAQIQKQDLITIQRDYRQFLVRSANQIYEVSSKGFITADDVQMMGKIKDSRLGAQTLSGYLKFDLDRDGTVSAEEIAEQMPYLQANERQSLGQFQLEVDTDGDGSISRAEIDAAVASQIEKFGQRRGEPLANLLIFDVNDDGRVTMQEIAAVAEFASKLPPERPSTSSTIFPAQPQCTLPAPTADQKLVFLSGYEGPALSTVAVSGTEADTTVASVIVEDGDEPLYIFATAYDPIVWSFEGATDRIQRLVVQPTQLSKAGPGAAVSGVPRDRIMFMPPKSCLDRAASDVAGARNAVGKLTKVWGRPPDSAAISYTLDHLRVPSGVQDTAKSARAAQPYKTPLEFTLGTKRHRLSGNDVQLLDKEGNPLHKSADARFTVRELMRYLPGGIVQFDANRLHAAGRIEEYPLLPNFAGLLQLVAEGVMTEAGANTYRLNTSIPSLPSEGSGSHGRKILVEDEVAVPQGSFARSTQIIRESTGECIGGRCTKTLP